MKMKYKIALGIIGILIIGHVYLGYSYSLWIRNFEGTETNTVKTGCFTIEFEEVSKSIHLKNTYPISDEQALAKVKPYQINVTNTCDTTDAGYSITLNTATIESKIADEKVKVAIGLNHQKPVSGTLLNKMEENLEVANIDIGKPLLKSYIINTGFIPKGQSQSFEIYLWIDENAGNEVMNQVFEAGIVVTTYSTKMVTMEEEIQNGDLTNGEGVIEQVSTNETDPSEFRYIGANPDNYLSLNNELWRIIGLVNTPNGSRVKIIRNNPLRDLIPMSASSSNNWLSSDIESYYKNSYLPSFDTASQNMLEIATWNLGSSANYSDNETGNPSAWITYEKSVQVMDGNPATYEGKLGLMSPSDYGYATSGGTTTNRETCVSTSLTEIGNYSDCINNNWLYIPDKAQWLMIPSLSDAQNYFTINASGSIGEQKSNVSVSDRPTAYLKNGLIIKGGNGTIGNPYKLN